MKKRTRKKLKKHGVTVAVAFVTTVATLALGSPKASADTVNLSELRTVDGVDYPVCFVEDCSDQPGQIGLWEDKDTGNWWLSLGERSYLVIDDTAIDID
ncbi:hypothetical protein TURBIDO_87 [Mycobacterium phage Turbido]|uniref:Uncharacterized protein n=7 Tax=Turbidovirus turbido TaxID=1993865 RepID=A0A1D8EZQ3_9CAUD|nr:hypothetical protein TURBIDO_87 [Mycobacterium phage Turbido]AOT27730.1 hypothetical protein SEA_JERM_88 [Mycobacterium phage Jerm]AWH13604.1 hypothetical protein SEA_ABBYPAIGE_88 [Mycobacterium phage AbbyPaige]AYD86636.1 membrane protein [Mycobacterium phage LilTurb]QBI96587.1 hypothetical protein SEA_WHABIGAIL7_85 [Mycobacterium phage Whabigail7]QUE25763.1 membrane protein [Mycobacterium phage Smeagan]QWS69817.1 membrane protein [Mycobacterium Phage Leviathan]QZD98266.1 hypothetical pro